MIRIALLTTALDDVELWQKVLNSSNNVSYNILNIFDNDWIEQCREGNYDLFLVKSPGTTHLSKQIFDERIQILAECIGFNIYPSLTQLRLHENKKYLSDWLKAKGLAHPSTDVILTKCQAYEYLKRTQYPLVFKQNIGSSGKGIRIINNYSEGKLIADKAFSKGVRPRIGPNLRTSSLIGKLKNAIKKKGLAKKRFSYYKAVYHDPQKYLIFQEYIPHKYEWRGVVIGDSYFAHKKMVSGKMASGSLSKNYDDPPEAVLDFLRTLRTKHDLDSTSVDFFETTNGFLINEIQTYFGQSDLFQMLVGGVPGRYRYLDGSWVFEPGDWASDQCYNLRLQHIEDICNVCNELC